ncbi:probable small intestine urate exporter isoform X1 [Rattus norvegicus]|uniref:Solute carrier family 17, member 4 n=1 Tax=Rattus norvegicus TaxID=10116 RepID=A0A0G2JXU5_RAT|nr:probable small intestine urate exporter [Rattus norvegicus]XP_008769880.1 probable small intestine urate exporter isoform X1 [Rattus norvegicus]XP_008769881.1 probable small intestine urate exporter isoform X1 [Rattus norvegicus]XP_038951982.1 probable small intestine urate exporter isoform X1 [Rattus norvegicus]|eukprot:NP_001258143.1 probable small intestine urate exporter [Rattus norvegicus]
MSTGADLKAREGGIPNDSNLNMTQEQSFKKGCCSLRHGLAFILHLCNFSVYTQQMNLSIAITAMVNTTAASSHANASIERPTTDSQDFWNETLQESKAPVYDWTPEIQGILLSSLNYGSFLAPIPTGYVAGVFGAKYVVGLGLLVSSVLTLFIPLAAEAGVALLIVLRVIQGMSQVMVLTGQYSMWAKWAPPLERSQLITIAASGSMLGTFLVLIAGGLLCQALGWPYIFYIFGGIGCACCLLWFPLVYDDPQNHPFISTGEKRYIMCSLAQEDCSLGWSLPIKAMVKSLPLWAIVVSYFCEYWLLFTIMAYTPTYISSVLQANLRDSGILSALPFMFGCVCIILGGLLADFLLSRNILRLVTIRKLFTALGVLVSSGILVPLPWVSSSLSTTMAFLVLSSVFASLCDSGALINFLDIAPRYAGFLKGLLQVFSYLAGGIAPTVAGFFISQDSEFGWRNVFLLAAAIDVVGLLFYLIFGRAEVQDWAKEPTFTHL